jgi:choline dehydrogenase-like flavoprotein
MLGDFLVVGAGFAAGVIARALASAAKLLD